MKSHRSSRNVLWSRTLHLTYLQLVIFVALCRLNTVRLKASVFQREVVRLPLLSICRPLTLSLFVFTESLSKSGCTSSECLCNTNQYSSNIHTTYFNFWNIITLYNLLLHFNTSNDVLFFCYLFEFRIHPSLVAET